MPRIVCAAVFLALLAGARGASLSAAEGETIPRGVGSSRLVVDSGEPLARLARGEARLELEIFEEGTTEDELIERPARIILTAADGTYLDGAGRGLYDGGRFYVDHDCALDLPAGEIQIDVASGPELFPVAGSVLLRAGERTRVHAVLSRFRRLSERGWFAGDSHVHARHDQVGPVRSDLAWAALQGRANGLDFVVEAGSNVSYDGIEALSTDRFLFARANEMRPGPFVGHLLAPGIRAPVPKEAIVAASAAPLPARRLRDEVAALGGALIHTHPLVPLHQAHWMGAVEFLSDAVLGECAHGFDVDSRMTETMWFAALELGNRVAACASTDSALGRSRTRSPGDRRVWVGAEELSWPAIAAAIREGRTVATDDGPVFALLRVGGKEPGATVRAAVELAVEVDVWTQAPLRRVELIWRGRHVETFDPSESDRNPRTLSTRFRLPSGEEAGWLVARAEDEAGHWAITSPVWVRAENAASPENEREGASAVIFEISNASRFASLSTSFFAHAIVTVAPPLALTGIRLLRDGELIAAERSDSAAPPVEPVPVTGMPGPYSEGTAWSAIHGDSPQHVQADWPVAETGWYRAVVLATGEEGAAPSEISSDEVFFDADYAESHALTVARLSGTGVSWRWWGYGEELPLDEIAKTGGADRWWYPQRTFARIFGSFGDETFDFPIGERRVAYGLIRDGVPAEPSSPTARVHLFDGRSLDGLYPWIRGSKHRDPGGVFRVEQGTIRVSGESLGTLATRRSFHDYHLVLEYRWGDENHGERVGKARDSGLFLHAAGADGNSVDGGGAFRSAIECQIMEGAVGDLLLIRGHDREGELIPRSLTAECAAESDPDGWPTYQPGGRPRTLETWGRLNWKGKDPGWKDELGFRGARDVESPKGEWTRLEVTCRGGEIAVHVNGVLVNRATSVRPQSGPILLQSEGSEIYVRRWELEPGGEEVR